MKAVLALGCLLAAADHVEAQSCPTARSDCYFRESGSAGTVASNGVTGGHLTALGVNALLGGLTGGVRRHAAEGSFWRGFLEGAGGGAAVYGGKLLSAESFWGAGLAGRQLAAVGASVVRNSSEGRPAFAELMLPFGPVRAYVRSEAPLEPRLKLDVLGTAVAAYRVFAADSRFDGGASISAGTPVFVTDSARRAGWHGNNTAGVILLLDRPQVSPPGFPDPGRVFAHERVHLLQYDQAQHTWGAPLEVWLLRRVPGGRWIERNLDLGLMMVPVTLLNQVIPYDQRPWEVEAHFLSEDRRVLTDRPVLLHAGSGTD